MTLVYSAHDTEHNDAVVLAEVLRRGLPRASGTPRSTWSASRLGLDQGAQALMVLIARSAALEVGPHSGHSGVGTGAAELELHVAVELGKALLAGQLRPLRSEESLEQAPAGLPRLLNHGLRLERRFGIELKARLGQVGAQLPASVVDGLVERATGRAEAFGEDIYRHSIQRDRDQDLALVGESTLSIASATVPNSSCPSALAAGD